MKRVLLWVGRLQPIGLVGLLIFIGKCSAQQSAEISVPEYVARPDVPSRYNINFGSGGLYFAAGLKGLYVDNIYLTHDDYKDDFILVPQLNVGGFFPIGQLNWLSADVGIAYYHYFRNDNLNTGTPTVNPNSDLKFHIYSGDFQFTLTEAFSYEETPFYETGAQFFNIYHTGRFARYLNRAGGNVRWDQHHLVLNTGYHHEDLLSNGSLFKYIDRHSEQFDFTADLEVSPSLTIGLEGAGSLNRFESKPESDHWRAAVGPAAKLNLTEYLTLRLGAGYQRIQYDSSQGDDLGLEGFNAFYAYGEVEHQINEFISHSLRVAHDNDVSVNAANLEGTHVTYSLNWKATENLTVSPYLAYHHYRESYGPDIDFLYHESFDYYAPGFGLTYNFGQHWQTSLKYDYRYKDSDDSDLSYAQNRVTVMITYLF